MKAIKLGAVWCSPCSQLSKQLAQEGIHLEEIDVDANKDIARKYNVRGVPTILILDDQLNEVERFVGASLTPAQFKQLRSLQS